MPVMQFANGLLQTLSVNAQLASDTTFTPSTSAGFPTAPQFTLLNIRTGELVLVTALGATWTITRAYGGSSASAFNAGDALQYSITREMLLGGMMVKLDEVNVAADTSAIQTLTVPSGLPFMRNLQLRLNGSTAADSDFQWRMNNDSSNNYWTNYAYWGSGSSSGQQQLTYGRCWSGGAAIPNISEVKVDIGGADATDRNKCWTCMQFLRQNAGGQFVMVLAGGWMPTTNAAISTIQIAAGSAWNNVNLRAGFRAQLYGVP